MHLDLSALPWSLVGWQPHCLAWLVESGQDVTTFSAELAKYQCTPEIPAHVPGAVQDDLLRAGLLPDWNEGLNAPLCEWVEHRHWEYRTYLQVPADWDGQSIILRAEGLDYAGQVLVDGRVVAAFRGMLVPHEFDLTRALRPGRKQTLSILFEEAPHEQGQIGYTSHSHYFKARYAYQWDWCPRLVPTGIWDRLTLQTVGPVRLHGCLPYARYDSTGGQGHLSFRIDATTSNTAALACHISVCDGDTPIADEILPCAFAPGRSETTLALREKPTVEPWWPNGMGSQKLYDVSVEIETLSGTVLDAWHGRVGFRQFRWLPCDKSPANAEPWICAVNGQPVFLQGVNWVPVRMTYGTVTREMYRKLLALYADLGVNILRVWGGGIPEKEDFYDLCDELGLMVWQEFPLSSSGADNTPPTDPGVLAELQSICTSYIWRRGGHASLLLWCGGNELTLHDGRNTPVNEGHPAVAAMAAVSAHLDPDRRFISTSPSGPSFSHNPAFGSLGMHHDIHGPWALPGSMAEWQRHWDNNDALFVSEVGVPSTSSVEILQRYASGLKLWPPSIDNPLWRYRTPWWIQWERYREQANFTVENEELRRYVAVSQAEQAEALSYMAAALKKRFPRCGGVIIWMGHDLFPCLANTAIVDYNGDPKPAALALKKVFRGE
jgi:beta-mannosidase